MLNPCFTKALTLLASGTKGVRQLQKFDGNYLLFSRSVSYSQNVHASTQHRKGKVTSIKEDTDADDPDFDGETDPFLRSEIKKYNVGKRWLARMMGEDPETFTQKDIDTALQYLLPSHLWAKDARPQMNHPYEVFPKSKESKFDEHGRPYSASFFTGKPKYYDLTYQIWEHMERLNTPMNQEPTDTSTTTKSLQGQDSSPTVMQWMKRFQLEQKLDEKMNEKLYETILFRLKRLTAHQRVHEVQGFLNEFQVPVHVPGKEDLKEVDIYEGAARAMGYRKTAIAEVTVREGNGQFTVNERPMIEFFPTRNDREQLMFPLLVVGQLKKFDIEAHVIGGGHSGKAGAIRLGMSRAIAALFPEHFHALNDSKLLLRDYRQRERKKPGRKRARRAFQWVKR